MFNVKEKSNEVVIFDFRLPTALNEVHMHPSTWRFELKEICNLTTKVSTSANINTYSAYRCLPTAS